MENRKATEAGQDITMQKEDFAALYECLRSVSAPREQVRSVAAFADYKTENQKLLMKVNFQHSF